MDRLTGKESSSLMEAYSSIYNKDNEEINEGLLDRTALQPLKQAAKTELKRLGSQALNKYLPMAYGATLKGGKDLAKAGWEATKTVGSVPANAFRYTLGDKGLLRNPVVQAGTAATGAVDYLLNKDKSVAAKAVKKVKEIINPNLADSYQTDNDEVIIECLNLIANHLIEGKYASDEKSALKIIENMSEGWVLNILGNYLAE